MEGAGAIPLWRHLPTMRTSAPVALRRRPGPRPRTSFLASTSRGSPRGTVLVRAQVRTNANDALAEDFPMRQGASSDQCPFARPGPPLSVTSEGFYGGLPGGRVHP